MQTFTQSDSKWIETWCRIGRANPWISEAWDPGFGIGSFGQMTDRADLIEHFRHGNWCLGTAFVLGDLVFINQTEGGGEYLVCRRDVKFESISAGHMVANENGEQEINAWLDRVEKATDEQLKNLTY